MIEVTSKNITSPHMMAFPVGPGNEKNWMMIFSGIAVLPQDHPLRGQSKAWKHDTLRIYLYDLISAAIRLSGEEPRDGFYLVFSADQWICFATLSSIYDVEQSYYAGFAVENVSVSNADPFEGIDVDLAASDSDAYIYRVGFHVTVHGKMREMPNP
jgi:hypothetical protein